MNICEMKPKQVNSKVLTQDKDNNKLFDPRWSSKMLILAERVQ
jgi:hypothetical protein